jgi:hypothetical protein
MQPIISLHIQVIFRNDIRSSDRLVNMWWSTVEIEGIQLQYHTTYIHLIFINIEIL